MRERIFIPKSPQNLVAEDELGLMGVHIGDRLPRPVVEENPSSDECMNVRIPLEGGTEGLNDGHHAGASRGLVRGGDHHLANGFVGEPGELSQELSMEQELGPEHLGEGEDPLGVSDVGENPGLEQFGEDRRALGPTGGTESAAFTGESDQKLHNGTLGKPRGRNRIRTVHNPSSWRRRYPRSLARSRSEARIALPIRV